MNLIILTSPTKKYSDITDAELCITEYNLLRLDRNCHGGGVLIYCHEKYSMTHLPKLCNSEFETLWVKIKAKNTRPFFVSVTYRSPSVKNPLDYSTRMCNYLTRSIKSLPLGSEVFCLGDFNVNFLSKCALTSLLKDFSRSCNLKQLIKSPTRITETTSSIIDLLFTNSLNILQSGSIICGLIDRNLIYCIIKYKKTKYEPNIIKF